MISHDLDSTESINLGISQHQIQLTTTTSAATGIALAGFWYPSCIGLIVVIINGWQSGFQISQIGNTLLATTYFVVGCGVLGLMISAMSGLVSIYLIYLMNRSVGYPIDGRSAAISAGSLAGYLPTIWIVFMVYHWDPKGTVTIAFFGPILAMSLGAWGAAWSSKQHARIKHGLSQNHRRNRLSIWHLMMATTWIAVSLAIANLFGGLSFAIAIGAWFGLQSLMLAMIHLCRKIRKRQLKH